MKKVKLSPEELEQMSHADVANIVLKENGKKMTIQDLFKEVIRIMSLPESYFESKIGDFVEDESFKSPAESAAQDILKAQLLAVIETLTPREQKVIRLRYGLDDNHPRTLEEVGKEFNVTRERIRQIEAKALRKLRNPNRSKRLEDFIE